VVRPLTQAAASHHSKGVGMAAAIGVILLLVVLAGGGLVVTRVRAGS
jgi:hypothetical protein